MGNLSWLLDLVLVGLLMVTLVHAVRLERALRSLREDRGALGEAIAGFDASARDAEAGIGRLQTTATGLAEGLGKRLEDGVAIRDDLAFLIERGEALADRLDALVRSGRALPAMQQPVAVGKPAVASLATTAAASVSPAAPAAALVAASAAAAIDAAPKLRSQAERDLQMALRAAR